MYIKSRKLMGMPVISLADGHQLGHIKKLIIDAKGLSIAGFILDRKGWFKEQPVIPYGHVKNIGSHAVTIDQAAAVVKLSSVPELEALVKAPQPLLGAKVITEEGTVLGSVEEFLFNPKDGRVQHLGLKGGLVGGTALLEAGAIATCGRDALIARAGAEELLQRPQGFLGQAWKSAGEAVAGVLDEVAKSGRATLESGRQALGKIACPWVKRDKPQPPEEPKED